MPFLASTMSRSKLSWLKATVSAVPCTSTMPPAPVMTKLESASAASPPRSRGRARACLVETAAHGGHLVAQHAVLHHVAQLHPLDAVVQRHPGPGDRAAVRVPPSACSTSQSIEICRSPSLVRSTIARSARPIRRWISWVRPEAWPTVTSRRVRSVVARGSMPYSAVTQPAPLPLEPGRHPFLQARRA